MALRRKPPPLVERTADGIVVNLQQEERDLVVRLLHELRGLLLTDDPAAAPMLRRLFPPAYLHTEDAEAESDYQRFMREELVASKLEAIEAVDGAVGNGGAMTDGQAMGLMQALNSVRLVLGTLLDVGEELAAVHAGHAHVGDDHVEGRHLHERQRGFAAFGEGHVPVQSAAVQHAPQARQDPGFVIDEKDAFHRPSLRVETARAPVRTAGRRKGLLHPSFQSRQLPMPA